MDNMEDKYKQCRPLMDILTEIPDFRRAKGKRYSLSSILALACIAMLCGYRSYRAFADWGSNYGKELMEALGFTEGIGPCFATFSNIFRKINVKLLEIKIGKWAESILAMINGQDNISLDGKTAKGGPRL